MRMFIDTKIIADWRDTGIAMIRQHRKRRSPG
jgi:hypothetical protein